MLIFPTLFWTWKPDYGHDSYGLVRFSVGYKYHEVNDETDKTRYTSKDPSVLFTWIGFSAAGDNTTTGPSLPGLG